MDDIIIELFREWLNQRMDGFIEFLKRRDPKDRDSENIRRSM